MEGEELIETDPLDANFTLKIPECTKKSLDRLPRALRQKVNRRILCVIDFSLHEAAYKKGRYLKEE